LGREISLGDKSVDEAFLEPPLRAAARALARGLKGVLLCPVEGDPPLRSDAAERVLGPIGTVKFCKLLFDDEGFSDDGSG